MPALFDTHCHLFMEPLRGNIEEVLSRAFAAGVHRVLVPSVSSDNWDFCSELSVFSGISSALGVHPWWAEDGVDIDKLENMLAQTGASAIGEIGLDWKTEVPRQKQFDVFEKQLELASVTDLPVVLHCRNAFDEMLELLKKHPVRGVVHGWSKGPQLMKRFLNAGLFISFGGAVTRPRALKARESARTVPMDRFVLETDSPSTGVAGVAAGNSRPEDILIVTDALASIKGQSLKDIQEAAWSNSVELFGESE